MSIVKNLTNFSLTGRLAQIKNTISIHTFKRHLYDYKNQLYYINYNKMPPEIFLILGYEIDQTGFRTTGYDGVDIYSFNNFYLHLLANEMNVKFKITPTRILGYDSSEKDICVLVENFFKVL